MPIFEYVAKDAEHSCDYCVQGFEQLVKSSGTGIMVCPRCGARVRKCVSVPSIGRSGSGFDDRAKRAGFHKLERLGKGEYEKKY